MAPYGYSGLWIHSLLLDPSDGVLYAGTDNGGLLDPPGRSLGSVALRPRDHICLLGGRYRATVMSQIPDWQAPQGLQVARGARRSTGQIASARSAFRNSPAIPRFRKWSSRSSIRAGIEGPGSFMQDSRIFPTS